MSHPGTGSHGAIRAEFPGGWPDHEANAFTGAGLDDRQRAALDFTRTLLNWRKSADVVHNGDFMHFTPIGPVYAYFRYDEDDTLMVILNHGEDEVDLDLARFTERLHDATEAHDVLDDARIELNDRLKLAPRSARLLEITH